MLKYIDCVDAGTEYCPCTLAQRKECIICSQLQDKGYCDCLNWKGTCMCLELISNGLKSKKSRQFKKFEVVEKTRLRADLFQLDIKVTKSLARDLNNMGAYVFLKKEEDIDAYSTPISIMNSDITNNIISVVIKMVGAKTKALDEIDKTIMVKGPFWNGVQGQKFLKDMKGESCLILARGIASTPAVLAAKKVIEKGNQVYVLLDRGRSKSHFTKNHFVSLGCKVEDISFFDRNEDISSESKAIIEHLLNKWNFKVVLSAGSDSFHSMMINYVHYIDKNVKFSTVSNTIMCCGEGVCGSCEIYNIHGESIRACKQQYDPSEVFLKEMGNR